MTVDEWVHLPPAELVAAVAVRPAPDMPMASLREIVRAVRDERGDVVDWRLDLDEVIDRSFDVALTDYRAWRRSWVQEWPIGPVSNVASLLTEARDIDYGPDRELDRALERTLRTDVAGASIEARVADQLAGQLEMVRLALSVDERSGFGVVDDMPTGSRGSGLARTWATPESEWVLAATPVTSLVVHPAEGLVLVHGDPESATTLGGVTSVDMRADTVVVLNSRGRSFRMSQRDARPLGWVVPRSLRWHVREVPLVAVWTLLFDGLGGALRTASEHGLPVRLDSLSLLGRGSARREFLDG
ncbi:MAG: hypothetical protein AB7L17_17245 [Ilumatobacteraceae bacterium]